MTSLYFNAARKNNSFAPNITYNGGYPLWIRDNIMFHITIYIKSIYCPTYIYTLYCQHLHIPWSILNLFFFLTACVFTALFIKKKKRYISRISNIFVLSIVIHLFVMHQNTGANSLHMKTYLAINVILILF